MTDVGLRERLVAYIREKVPTVSRNVDVYLSENMPRLIVENDLSSRNELFDIDMRLKFDESRVDEMENWQNDVQTRIDNLKSKVKKLEHKYPEV